MKVSVVMPVRNGERYLDRAIQSILEQTFTAFELVVLDDSSTDATASILERWSKRDERVRVERSDRAPGVASSANEVVRRALGDLVARMDADDVAMPRRLERQVEVFRQHPDCVLCGTLSIGIDGDDRLVRPPDRSRVLRRGLFPPFPHGSVMFQREVFDAVGGYRSGCEGWEDVDLWVRMTAAGQAYVIAEALYAYRHTTTSFTVAQPERYVTSVGFRLRAEDLVSRGQSYAELDLVTPLSAEERLRARARAEAERMASLMWAGSPPSRGERLVPIGLYGAVAARSPRLTRALRRSTIAVVDRLAGARLRSDVREWRASVRP